MLLFEGQASTIHTRPAQDVDCVGFQEVPSEQLDEKNSFA